MIKITRMVPVTIEVEGESNKNCSYGCECIDHEYDICTRFKFYTDSARFKRCQECIDEFGTEVDHD